MGLGTLLLVYRVRNKPALGGLHNGVKKTCMQKEWSQNRPLSSANITKMEVLLGWFSSLNALLGQFRSHKAKFFGSQGKDTV